MTNFDMASYYNEIDPYAAQWLRNLITAGHIAFGDVDERSITDVRPDDLKGYTQCHFFAGIGGWSYALRIAGWPDDKPVWTGSCPCQPFSSAGKQRGIDDERHLWPVWKRLIDQCHPSVVFGEQVAAATTWLKVVRSDLEEMDYAVATMPIEAACVGAPHLRDRFWFASYSKRHQQPWTEPCSRQTGRVGRKRKHFPWNESWQDSLSWFRDMGDGLSRCVAATDAIRNAIVPQVASEFIGAFVEVLNERNLLNEDYEL